jgi:hypothetical protein
MAGEFPGTNASAPWAQEVTLKQILTQLKHSRIDSFDSIDSFEKELEEITRRAKLMAREFDAVTASTYERDARENQRERLREQKDRERQTVEDRNFAKSNETFGKYNRAVQDLAASTTSGQGAMRGLSQVTSSLIQGLQRKGGLIGAAGGIASTALVIGGIFYERIKESANVFAGMIDKGLYFDGSITQFAENVRNTGLSLEEFAGITGQFGTTIAAVGEKQFLDSVDHLGKRFGALGMNVQKGAEYFAEYMETLRLTGSLYNMTQREQEEAFNRNITQLNELSRLYGIDRKRLIDSQKEFMQLKRAQLYLATQTPEAQQQILAQQTQLQNLLGLSADAALRTIVAGREGQVTPGTPMFALQQAIPDIQQIIASGSAEQLEASIRASGETVKQILPSVLPYIMAGTGKNAEDMANIMARILEINGLLTRTIPGKQPGETPTDAATQTFYEAQTAAAKMIGQIDAKIIAGAGEALAVFNKELGNIVKTLSDQGIKGLIDKSEWFEYGALILGALGGIGSVFKGMWSAIRAVPAVATLAATTATAATDAITAGLGLAGIISTATVGAAALTVGAAGLGGYAAYKTVTNADDEYQRAIARGDREAAIDAKRRYLQAGAMGMEGGPPLIPDSQIAPEVDKDLSAAATARPLSVTPTPTPTAPTPAAPSPAAPLGLDLTRSINDNLSRMVYLLGPEGDLYQILKSMTEATTEGHRRMVIAIQNQ